MMDNLGALIHLFKETPRQGPGDFDLLKRMIAALNIGDDAPRIGDLGCGTGATAIELAEEYGATVVAVDKAKVFIDKLESQLSRIELTKGEVEPLVGDMLGADLERRSLDLIVSEGAAYNVGFADALESWRSLLRPGGGVVISECVWFGEEHPEEVAAFWAEAYSDMKTISAAIKEAENCGYRLVAAERLQAKAWDDFYQALKERMRKLKDEANFEKNLAVVIDETKKEMSMMSHSYDHCGYCYFAFDLPEQSFDD